jgi:hypothetical protein
VEHAELQTGSSRKCQSVERALIAGVAKSEFVCARDEMHMYVFLVLFRGTHSTRRLFTLEPLCAVRNGACSINF